MPLLDPFRVHNSARILAGKYSGLVGTVTEVDREGGQVKVSVQGVKDGEGVSFERWFKPASLEVHG